MTHRNETMMRFDSNDIDDNVSCVTAGSKMTLETVEETLSSAERELLQLPGLLYAAVNNGDMVQFHQIVTRYFNENCLLQTPTMDAPVYGIQYILSTAQGAQQNIPDFVISATNVRFIPGTDSSPRCIVFDRNFVGTNIFPADSAESIHNYNKIEQLLDPSLDNEEQKTIVRKIQDKSAPYAMRGGGTIRWVLDDHSDKISEFWSGFTFSAIKPGAGVKL